jgi:hypothetical protein
VTLVAIRLVYQRALRATLLVTVLALVPVRLDEPRGSSLWSSVLQQARVRAYGVKTEDG